MAEPFRLRVEDREWIIHRPLDPYNDGYVLKAKVEVRADCLTAQTTATLETSREASLGAFFAGLVSDWRGWSGVRRWEALEHEMTVDAWHDGRAHVMIAVTIKRSPRAHAEDAWSARVVFTVEAGEQLNAIARDLAALLAP